MPMPHWYQKPTVERRLGGPRSASQVIDDMCRPDGPLDFFTRERALKLVKPNRPSHIQKTKGK